MTGSICPRLKEHQGIEWKESWRDEYLKWISGFANAEEFDFRYCLRSIPDGARAAEIVKAAEGKRLTLRALA